MRVDELIAASCLAAERFGQEPLVASVLNGTAIISNCNFGFMVQVREVDGGRAEISCANSNVEIRGPAEYQYVKRTIAAWQRAIDDYDGPRTYSK